MTMIEIVMMMMVLVIDGDDGDDGGGSGDVGIGGGDDNCHFWSVCCQPSTMLSARYIPFNPPQSPVTQMKTLRLRGVR